MKEGNAMVIKKNMEVTVDTDIARKMLMVAGYYDIDSKTDEEVFNLAISMNVCYAVTYEERKE
jgi:hypothetical protein